MLHQTMMTISLPKIRIVRKLSEKKLTIQATLYQKGGRPMWYVSWDGDLVFGNESLFAFNVARYRKMRPVREMGQTRTAKHIVSRSRSVRSHAVAAKDG